MNTPILFLIFNRPDTTQRVFDEIRKAKPSKLYVAADGAREERGETEKNRCEVTRKIVTDNIDWDCEVKTLFRDENLGCGLAVSSAIRWFFDNEEMGIIIEDDILPHPDFFPFMEEMLEKYKDDNKVYLVSGFGMSIYPPDIQESYYFSVNSSIWGWGAWRKTWEIYDYSLNSFSSIKYLCSLCQMKLSLKEIMVAYSRLLTMKMGLINTWDYQFVVSMQYHKKLSTIPTKLNSVWNIGFGADATHTFSEQDETLFGNKVGGIFPLQHPNSVSPNRKFDSIYNNKLNWYRRFPLTFTKLMLKYFLFKTKFYLPKKIA